MNKTANTLVISAFAAGTALAALPAGAAPTPGDALSANEAEQLCSMLDEQFQFVMKFKTDLPYADEARALHDSGVKKCEGGNPAEGVSDLRQSLETMYVEPATL